MVRCGKCANLVLSRTDIEDVMREIEDRMMSDYRNRMATVVTPSKACYVQEFLMQYGRMCGCEVLKDVEPALRVVRSDYRDAIREKFGSDLSLDFLLSMPNEMMAWENSSLVRMKRVGNTWELSEQGQSLAMIVQMMSMMGRFDKGRQQFDKHVLLNEYSYLRAVKMPYRTALALRFGPSVSMSALLSVSTEWLDWDVLPLLKCREVNNNVVLDTVLGFPAVSFMTTALVSTLIPRLRPLVKGSYVSESNVCVQFLPNASAVPPIDFSLVKPVPVLLTPGQSYVPLGRVLFDMDRFVLNIQPGVDVYTPKGDKIDGRYGVSVFMNGMVELVLVPVGKRRAEYDKESVTSLTVHHVHVCVEPAHAGSALDSWWNARLDSFSTEARYAVSVADAVLLHSPLAVGDLAISPGRKWVFHDDPVATALTNDVDLIRKAYVKNVRIGEAQLVSEVSTAIRAWVPVSWSGLKFVINGVFEVAVTTVLLAVDGLHVAVGAAESGVVCDDEASTLSEMADACVVLHTAGDSFAIDRGGPSDSGGYADETVTYVKGWSGMAFLSDVARHRGGDCMEVAERYSSMHFVLKDPVAFYMYNNPRISLMDLLLLPAKLFDFDKFVRMKFSSKKGAVRLKADTKDGLSIAKVVEMLKLVGYSRHWPTGSLASKLLSQVQTSDEVEGLCMEYTMF